MFLNGPFLHLPFQDNAGRGARVTVAGTGAAAFQGRLAATALLTGGIATVSFMSKRGVTMQLSGAAAGALLGACGVTLGSTGTGATSFKGKRGVRLSASGLASTSINGVAVTNIVFRAQGSAVAQFGGATVWDRMLSDTQAPIAYFAEIEPWVLTDRS